MFFTFALVTALSTAPADTVPVDTVPAPMATAGPFIEAPVGIGASAAVDDTTPSRRRKAIEVSDSYAIRLKIHYIASYATIPIFAAQAIVGEQLYNAENKGNPPPCGNERRARRDRRRARRAVRRQHGHRRVELVGDAPPGERTDVAHGSRAR